ncbi:hypothetical protein CISIN_1g015251mg [Citrus sinensis]|uniref:F-box domain-containing protein n=1 Tax=Citrus sinensis TaxID=2711 RepID=A0A067F4Q3_CITSI|nr:hypothetical protein CISIN_1g015251mg [Citrus sinensis]KDO58466.1 hypothetical protein CISIN_1g015251mg [Citrus sinensis]KDO58467.1 hypothetical protein CISIN_1g015251mg [Citrus sinensis]
MELDVKQKVNKRSKLEDDHQQATGMETLPREIVLHILLRLPITSLVQFKFVCRAWRALAQDPLLANLHNTTSTSKAEKNPCLILHCDFPIRNQLCFIDFSDNQDKYPDQEVVFGFGFHPVSKEYKVIKIVYYRKSCSNSSFQRTRRVIYPRSDVQVYTVGSPAWRSKGKLAYQFVRRPSEALVKGRLHWVTRPRRYSPVRGIVSFDIADEQFREVPKPDCGGLNRCNYHLTVLSGCLSVAVYGNYGKLEIWVMKDYNVKESWAKELNIGAYIPKGLKQSLDRPLKIWKNSLNGRVVRVVCILEKGEILLEYKSRVLVSYDPKRRTFNEFVFKGTPNWFQTIVHQGSFNWIDTPHDL